MEWRFLALGATASPAGIREIHAGSWVRRPRAGRTEGRGEASGVPRPVSPAPGRPPRRTLFIPWTRGSSVAKTPLCPGSLFRLIFRVLAALGAGRGGPSSRLQHGARWRGAWGSQHPRQPGAPTTPSTLCPLRAVLPCRRRRRGPEAATPLQGGAGGGSGNRGGEAQGTRVRPSSSRRNVTFRSVSAAGHHLARLS